MGYTIMFYTGMTVGRCSIGLAISKDGIVWEKQRDAPFLEPGPEEWDSVMLHVRQLSRVLRENGASTTPDARILSISIMP